MYWLCRGFGRQTPYEIFSAITRFVVCRAFGSRPYRSMRLIAYPPHRIDALDEVVEALDLVRRTDARLFRRIDENIRQIVLGTSRRPDILGTYWPLNQVCYLRKLPIFENTHSVAIYSYAATLVHEATHGILHKKRIPTTSANKPRIERICYKEETRLMKKLLGHDMKAWKAYLDYLSVLAWKRGRSSEMGRR